jgi:hypothetical protein
MRRLETVHEKAFSLRIAGDPRAAMAHFAIEVGEARVYRNSDSRCHVVVPPDGMGDVHVVGAGELGELMPVLKDLPTTARIIMSTHTHSRISRALTPRSGKVIDVFVGTPGMGVKRVPPPRPDFDVRTVLYSDVPAWRSIPKEAAHLVSGYKTHQEVLARSVAYGAFNGRLVGSVATAELGRTFANIKAYTRPELRARGLATHCVASILDHVRPSGERPMFMVEAVNGSPERAMARHFGLEKAGELVAVSRRHMAF